MSAVHSPCCDRCQHSPQTPCRDLIRCLADGPVCHDDPACRETTRARAERLRRRRVSRPAILVGMGTCGLAAGAGAVFAELASRIHQGRLDLELVATGCIGFCEREPLVDVRRPGWNRVLLDQVQKSDVESILELAAGRRDSFPNVLCQFDDVPGLRRWEGVPAYAEVPFFAKQVKIVLENCGHIDPSSIDEYIASGGYSALDKVLRGIPPETVVEEVLRSGLRGRGGGGFPTGKKWQFARQAQGEKKYVVCNADEGDPGAFMDRSVLEGDPHRCSRG